MSGDRKRGSFVPMKIRLLQPQKWGSLIATLMEKRATKRRRLITTLAGCLRLAIEDEELVLTEEIELIGRKGAYQEGLHHGQEAGFKQGYEKGKEEGFAAPMQRATVVFEGVTAGQEYIQQQVAVFMGLLTNCTAVRVK